MAECLCIVVTYNPSIDYLSKVVKSILDNKVGLLVVDNGSFNQDVIKNIITKEDGHFIGLDENVGIAAAQNRGIEFALKHEYEYIWLSDQDTVYKRDFSKRMLNLFKNSSEADDIAAIGPSFLDTNRNVLQPIVSMKPFTQKRQPEIGFNQVSHMIASGMVIPIKKIQLVGMKQENLFIDWVDMEWCWRAEYLFKQKLYVVGDVQIVHTLGDTYVNFFGRKIIMRSSFRHYFMVRNAIALAIYSRSTPFFVSLELFLKGFVWAILLPLLAPQDKLQHLKATLTGVFHGLFNRLGPK